MYPAFALKNISRRKLRSFLSTLGILLGVALIVSLASISDGLEKTMEGVSKQIGGTIYVVEAGKFGNTFASRISSSQIEQIEKIPGVKTVAPVSIALAEMEGYVGAYSFIGDFVYLTGVLPDKEKQVNSMFTKMLSGRFVSKGETEMVVLGSSLAEKTGKNVGDLIKVKARGTWHEFGVVGIFESASDDDDHVILDMAVYKKITGEPPLEYNIVGVVPTSDALSGTVERKIKILIPTLDPSYARAAIQSAQAFARTLKIATWVIAGIAALIGGLGIANAMIMSVSERTKDFGILKAVGWKNSDIVGIVVLESVIISSVGAIIGIAIGFLVSKGLLPIIIRQFETDVSLTTIVWAFLFALVLGVGGAIAPAKRAADLDPVAAFRGGAK